MLELSLFYHFRRGNAIAKIDKIESGMYAIREQIGRIVFPGGNALELQATFLASRRLGCACGTQTTRWVVSLYERQGERIAMSAYGLIAMTW